MKKFSIFETIKEFKTIVESKEYLRGFRRTEKCFTRVRKMPFCDIIYFMISSMRRSVQYELDRYISKRGVVSISRQAFAKSRENILPEGIKYITEQILSTFEKKDGEIQKLHGYRIFAVDGSIIDLPENEKLREVFGYSTGSNNSSHCKGKAMVCYDVLNYICPYGELISYFESEKTHMKTISDYFKDKSEYENSIFVLDRGYKSLNLINHLQKNGQKFVLRVDEDFHKKAIQNPVAEQIVTLKKKGMSVKVRVIKFTLPSGNQEILVTNLLEDFTYDEITTIYAKRWGVETTYHYIKNLTLLENFTGESVTAVLQDFYVSILLMNFTAIAYREQEDVLENKKRLTKYKYKPNTTNLVRTIKVDFIKMLNANSKICKVFRELFLFKNIYKYAYAQVDGRSCPRLNKRSNRKSHPKSKL